MTMESNNSHHTLDTDMNRQGVNQFNIILLPAKVYT
jgi:hypothetical protein